MLKASLVAFAAAGFSVLPLIPKPLLDDGRPIRSKADVFGRTLDEAINVLGVPASTECSGGSLSLVYDGFRVVSHGDRVVLIEGAIGRDHVPQAPPESAPYPGQSVAAFCACVDREPKSSLVSASPTLEIVFDGGWRAWFAHGRLMGYRQAEGDKK